jgi:hypothetical protein
MWEWLTEKSKMPKFVWVGVLLILVAIAYQIFRAQHLLIDLNDRTLEVVRREESVADKEKHVLSVAGRAIEELERVKTSAPPTVREKFSVAQRAIRKDVREPLLKKHSIPVKKLDDR